MPVAAPTATAGVSALGLVGLSGLASWQLAALGLLVCLLLAYIIYRMWLAARARRAENVPLLTKQTQFRDSNPGHAANTVFGLSDKDAHNMHAQWMNQQMNQPLK
jgi:ABC-type transport system involved in cytochrome bd biosynthesis fused ATPase/permease subunit